MDLSLELLEIQNPWWEGGSLKFDPVLAQYDKNRLKWRPEILGAIDLGRDGIYFLAGSRGVGKTTTLKLLVKKLIEQDKIRPERIFYYSCHNLDSAEQLNEMIKLFLSRLKRGRPLGETRSRRAYVMIDEISLIKNWQTGVNHLALAGKLKGVTVILSGSYLESAKLDGKIKLINLSGLSFAEFIKLINPTFYKKVRHGNYSDWVRKIEYYLDIYLLTGGHISAINDFYDNGAVSQSVYSNYIYWLLANVARLGRDAGLLRQIMEKIILNLGRPVGFKTLARKTKAKTHLTAAEYLNLLESMFAVKTVYQYDGGKPDSRKAKKIYFQDPFIFWQFYCYSHGSLDYWRFSRERLHDKQVFFHLLENAVFSHIIKSEKNNISYWRDNAKKQEINFLAGRTPILIRYERKISEADFNIFKNAGFKKGIIVSRDVLENRGGIKIIPLAYFLLFYGELI